MNIAKLKKFIINKLNTELAPSMYYHGAHHTLEVLNVCNAYIKRLKVNSKDAYLLRTAALLHDIGFIWASIDHEEIGVKYARKLLREWKYKNDEIELVCGMIKATKIPQNPENLLEEIICDADLDYLGTNKFQSVGDTLYKELVALKFLADKENWDKTQINFLSTHEYHTEFAKKHKEPIKRKHLSDLINKHDFNLII